MGSKKVAKLIAIYQKQKLSHVHLIETNNQNFCINDLIPLIKALSCPEKKYDYCDNCSVCHQINNFEIPNLIIVEPNGKNIKKEQIIELKRKCSSMPYLTKNNIYIIKSAEKLNSSSSNTMLKFIEEPFDNCYGFFITNNKENIISTIKSRAQILIINYKELAEYDKFGIDEATYQEYLNVLKEYLFKIEVEKNDGIMYNKIILNNQFKEIKTIEILFNIIFEIYSEYFSKALKINWENKYADFNFISLNSINALKQKKEIILNLLNALSYNVNLDLFLDRFIIEMGEINDKENI